MSDHNGSQFVRRDELGLLLDHVDRVREKLEEARTRYLDERFDDIKTDISDTRRETEEDIKAVQEDIKAVREDVQEVKDKIATRRRIDGVLIGLGGAIGVAVKFGLDKLFLITPR